MATINKTFTVKNGIDVANTLIIDSNRNLSNINTANILSTLTVGGNDLYNVVNTTGGIYVANAVVLSNSSNVDFVNTSTVIVTGSSSNYLSSYLLQGPITTNTNTFTTTVNAGSLLVVAFYDGSGAHANGYLTFSDNVNGSWTQTNYTTLPNDGDTCMVFHFINSQAGTIKGTATGQSGGAGSSVLAFHEFSNVATSSALDQTANAYTSGATSISTASLTDSQTPDLIFTAGYSVGDEGPYNQANVGTSGMIIAETGAPVAAYGSFITAWGNTTTSSVVGSFVNMNNRERAIIGATFKTKPNPNAGQAVVSFNVNSSMNLTSLNVSGNIANAGNVVVTQNVITGNLFVTQNVTEGNLSVTQNISAGNISAGNISAGNISVTNPILQLANVNVFVTGTSISQTPNLNFVAANTSNLTVVGTHNTSPGNVTVSIDTAHAWGAPPASPNLSIQVNVAGTLTGTANVLVNTAANNVFIEGNVQLANASTLNFGGNQGSIASANFAIVANVTSNSLDFIWG